MTTNMAVPQVRDFGPRLDERIAYGNLPKWIVEGVPVRGLNVPVYHSQLTKQPPLYAGHSTGVIRNGPFPRQDPNLKVGGGTKKAWPAAGDHKMTSYVPKVPELKDSPYMYSTPATMNPQTQPGRSWKYNVYNTHAKAGFKFWMEEKKPLSASQKYTFGSTKTFHGLGDAPRN